MCKVMLEQFDNNTEATLEQYYSNLRTTFNES